MSSSGQVPICDLRDLSILHAIPLVVEVAPVEVVRIANILSGEVHEMLGLLRVRE